MINEALGEEREAMIIEANHRPICWAREHDDQSALFNNPLNSAQILTGNGRFLNFSTEWYRGRYFWQHYFDVMPNHLIW